MTDARITLPKDGASTWAIGNHKCNRYTGLLTSIGIDSISTARVLEADKLVTYTLNTKSNALLNARPHVTTPVIDNEYSINDSP